MSAMSRALGEGRIVRLTANEAYINSEKLGKVYFPRQAANVHSNDVTDLTEKFQLDENVLFTAQKNSVPSPSGALYTASSVVKKRELIMCSGTISLKHDNKLGRFCCSEVKKYGRVFVPYSARQEPTKAPWLGKGAVDGKKVSLKIFRQPEINQCRYVAWSVTIDNDSNRTVHNSSTNGGSSSKKNWKINDNSSDIIPRQLGVIVNFNLGDMLLYSPQTGLSLLPGTVLDPTLAKLGRFLSYDVIKPSNEANPEIKAEFLATNPADEGILYPLIEDSIDRTRLQLEVYAVVTRVSYTHRVAWFWNDFIGRIYAPSIHFDKDLRAMDCVKITALYTAAFEDVPWSVMNIELLGENDEIRYNVSQCLLTSDDWKVTFIQVSPQSFFGFIESPTFGSAFTAWTDLAAGEDPPPVHSRCKVTVYRLYRGKKHGWRAVLLSTINDNGKPNAYHPAHDHTNERILPELFEKPQEHRRRQPCLPPQPVPNQWASLIAAKNENGSSRGSPTQYGVIGGQLNGRRSSNGSYSANGSLSNISSSNAVSSMTTPGAVSPVHSSTQHSGHLGDENQLPRLDLLSQRSSPADEMVNALTNQFCRPWYGQDFLTWGAPPVTSPANGVVEKNNGMFNPSSFGNGLFLEKQPQNPWACAKEEFGTSLGPIGSSLGNNGSCKTFGEASTQTDPETYETAIRKIVGTKELREKFASLLPDVFNTVLQLLVNWER